MEIWQLNYDECVGYRLCKENFRTWDRETLLLLNSIDIVVSYIQTVSYGYFKINEGYNRLTSEDGKEYWCRNKGIHNRNLIEFTKKINEQWAGRICFIMSNDRNRNVRKCEDNIRTLKICTVCRTALHTMRCMHLINPPLNSMDVHSAYSKIQTVHEVQTSWELQNSKKLLDVLTSLYVADHFWLCRCRRLQLQNSSERSQALRYRHKVCDPSRIDC